MNCFYCGGSVSRSGNLPQTKLTTDHVYPRWMLHKLSLSQQNKLTRTFHDLNKVKCCSECNGMKGRLHPIDWLVIMPNPFNAEKMAEHLVKMGEDVEEVFGAMKRRREK